MSNSQWLRGSPSRFPPFEMVALVVVTDVRALPPEVGFALLLATILLVVLVPWSEWIFWRMSSRSDLGITIRFPRSSSPSSTDISRTSCVFLATGSDRIGRVAYTPDEFRLTIAEPSPNTTVTKSDCVLVLTKMKILLNVFGKSSSIGIIPSLTTYTRSWSQWRSKVLLLTTMHVPRCYKNAIVSTQLHGFSVMSRKMLYGRVVLEQTQLSPLCACVDVTR